MDKVITVVIRLLLELETVMVKFGVISKREVGEAPVELVLLRYHLSLMVIHGVGGHLIRMLVMVDRVLASLK